MQRRRRYAGLVAAGLVTGLLATLTACGDTGPLSDRTTLKVVAIDHGDRSGNSSKRWWDKLIGEYQFDHGDVEVDVDVYDRSRIDQKVAELAEAGNPPDIAITSGTFAEYAEREKLHRASDVLSTFTQGSFVASLAEAGTVGRVQYGIPFSASTRMLFYNKKLFAEAGVEEPPGTWEELLEAARALRTAGVPSPYGLPLGPEEAQAETLNWMLGGGGNYTDDGGAYDLDSPQNVATFTWLRDDLVGAGLTNEDPATTDRDAAYAAFTQGDVAMLNGHPGLMRLALENGIDFGTAPLPGKDGPVETTTGVADWLMAFDNGEGREEHVRSFLDFVYGEKYVTSYADTYDMLPVTTPATQAMRDDAQYKPLWKFLEALDTARFYPVGKTSWGPVLHDLKTGIGSAVLEKGDPKAVLGRLQRDAMSRDVAEAE
ncbi:extracellular solute-binding protein [Streptomyces sp. JJ36]|uniref:extracellular solute-binding protein n=1 Tax=Streptomyces sp. JJ36 TaxID=2736645 RepID=UPI001F396E19|nr:extracellular solute-binding protein [Streptomyces sp. JJ36]MCF6524252.1 extracellular solute-binding protein [Streptomyces sp. JJ36]